MPRLNRQYLVIACTNCNRLLLASSDKKTRTCPYCGKRVKAEEAQIIARSDDPKAARKILQEAKNPLRGMISTGGKDSR